MFPVLGFSGLHFGSGLGVLGLRFRRLGFAALDFFKNLGLGLSASWCEASPRIFMTDVGRIQGLGFRV